MLDAAVQSIAREWRRVIWNRTQAEVRSPFDNSGAVFDTEDLSIHACSWDAEIKQPWNLKCGDVEVRWYKHSLRGLSVNKLLNNDEIAQFLDAALAALRPIDTVEGYPARQTYKPFTLNGVRYAERRKRQARPLEDEK